MSRSYQTNGKPLSQTAIYQQKLKQGVYTSPGINSVGVNLNASDTAALLAASADLTVKPSYERVVAKDAHTAALAAKKETITAWSRDQPHPDAAAASFNRGTARSNTMSSTALSVSTGVPSFSGDTLYKTANQNSTSTMTSRINPERNVSRLGIATKGSTGSGLNIGKILQVANKNSTKLLSLRFNPELDYRSGVQSQKPAEYLTQDEEDLAAHGASASLKLGFTNEVSQQRRSNTFLAHDVVDATLLAAASKKANERLELLTHSSAKDFKQQAQLYANALAVAQKNSDERVRQHKAGVINLGGGLTMLQLDLDALATQIVIPVVLDITVKADARREADDEHKTRSSELAELHKKSKQEAATKRSQEKADFEIAKQKRTSDNEKRKRGEDSKYEAYQAEKAKELEDKKTELEELKAKHEEEKKALLAEKKENEDRIAEEEAKLQKERKDELDTAQAEKDEIIKPTLDELAEESAKLKSLTDAKAELDAEVSTYEKQKAEYEEQIAQLEKELEETKADIEKYTTDLETATKEHEDHEKEHEELKASSTTAFIEHEEALKLLAQKHGDLEKEKEQHLTDKESHKKQILEQIDEKVKDEHKINRELPEHQRIDVDEDKLRDTGSLFSVEEKEPALEDVIPPKEKEVEGKKEENVEKKTEKKTEKPAEKKATPASPTKKSQPAPTSPEKKSGFRRFGGLFRKKEKPAKGGNELYEKKRAEVLEKTGKAEKVEPTVSNLAKKTDLKRSTSDATGSDLLEEDENRGGLFKEEI